VTQGTPAIPDADDARLLNMVRAGDPAAFAVIYERHAAAVRRLAGRLVSSPAEVDDVVAEAFARLLEVTRRGGGPTNAVRPYLLTALRRVCYERLHGQTTYPTDEWQLRDPGEPIADPAVAGLESSLIARAYLSLPERWRAVLWHTEVEQAGPAEVAPLLGLTPSGVAGLGRRATDGLRQAYLRMHIARISRPECRHVAERLGAYIHDALPPRDTTMVAEHLRGCSECRTVHDELADVGTSLRSGVAPLVLGTTAAAYLSDSAEGGADGVTAAGIFAAADTGSRGADIPARLGGSQPTLQLAAANAAGIAAGAASDSTLADGATARAGPRHALRRLGHLPPLGRLPRLGRLQQLRQLPRPSRGVAVGGSAALAAAAAIALVLTLTGGGTRVPTSAKSPAVSPSGVAAVQASPSASVRSPSPSPTPSPSPSPSPTPSPSPLPAAAVPAPAAATLSASLTAQGWGPGTLVSFQVSNDGSASTGTLTAWLSLPPGSSLFGSGGGGGSGNWNWTGRGAGSGLDGTAIPEYFGGAWNCQSASGGATCTHDPLSPGAQTEGALYFTSGGSSACGQLVSLTVTSGPVTASAAQYVRC